MGESKITLRTRRDGDTTAEGVLTEMINSLGDNLSVLETDPRSTLPNEKVAYIEIDSFVPVGQYRISVKKIST